MEENSELNEVDKKNLANLNTFIERGSCVLFLGPLFGVDETNGKIHQALKKSLTDPPNSLLLDDEFENLFISKKSDGSQDLEIITRVDNFYKNIKRNIIYDQILALGFKAIITYTSDLFLYYANEETKEYDFFAFSKKGNTQVVQDEEQSLSKNPVIYNIFGDIRDTDTMIINYDSLYDFFLNIIKAEKEFPLQLRNILGQATAFLFLGFNLTKWYVPLIIRKLHQFIQNNNTKRFVRGFVCLDDTPRKFSVAEKEDLSEEIKYSLSKYPLLFEEFKEISSFQLVQKLHEMPRDSNQKTAIARDRLPTDEEKKYFKQWREESLNRGAPDSLEIFFLNYKNMKYEGTNRHEFSGLSMQYNQYTSEKQLGTLPRENFNAHMQSIIQSLFAIIDKLI